MFGHRTWIVLFCAMVAAPIQTVAATNVAAAITGSPASTCNANETGVQAMAVAIGMAESGDDYRIHGYGSYVASGLSSQYDGYPSSTVIQEAPAGALIALQTTAICGQWDSCSFLFDLEHKTSSSWKVVATSVFPATCIKGAAEEEHLSAHSTDLSGKASLKLCLGATCTSQYVGTLNGGQFDAGGTLIGACPSGGNDPITAGINMHVAGNATAGGGNVLALDVFVFAKNLTEWTGRSPNSQMAFNVVFTVNDYPFNGTLVVNYPPLTGHGDFETNTGKVTVTLSGTSPVSLGSSFEYSGGTTLGTGLSVHQMQPCAE